MEAVAVRAVLLQALRLVGRQLTRASSLVVISAASTQAGDDAGWTKGGQALDGND
jgi:hypothetical protein